MQHTFPEPHAWTSAHLVVQRQGYRDEYNSLFSSQEALILLLWQFINTSKYVSSVENRSSQRTIPKGDTKLPLCPQFHAILSLQCEDHGLS